MAIITLLGILVTVVIAIVGWMLFLSPDFSISVNPMDGSVQQGGTASLTVTVKSIDGYDQRVSLSASGQPSDMIATFSPPFGGPTPSYSSNVLIDVGQKVSVGDYPLVIKGTGADGKEHTCTYTLTVKPSAPSTYALSVSSSPISDVSFTLDDVSYTTKSSMSLDEGKYVVAVPSEVDVSGTTYVFVNWSDGSAASTKTVNLSSDISLTAYFEEEIQPLEITITSPLTGTLVSQSITLEGYANRELSGNQHLYIVTDYEGLWWPQDDEVTFDYSQSSGRYNFDVLVGIGSGADVGKTFTIRAIVVDSDVHQDFQNWFEQSESTGEWIGISITEVNQMGNIQIFDSVSVTRQ